MHPDFNVIICTDGDTIIGTCNSFSGSQRELITNSSLVVIIHSPFTIYLIIENYILSVTQTGQFLSSSFQLYEVDNMTCLNLCIFIIHPRLK